MKIDFIQNFIDRLRHKIPDIKTLVNKKLAYDYKNPNDIHTLLFGSSHLNCGYRAKEGEFNFAVPSQDLYYNYELYKKYNTKSVNNIIVSFSVFTPALALIKTKMFKKCVLYKVIYGIDYQFSEIAEQKKFYKIEKYYLKEVNRYLRNLQINPENYYGNMLTYPKDEYISKDIKEAALGHYKNNQRKNDEMEYCIKLIQATALNKQNLFFVIPPATDEYKNYLPNSKELFKKLYEICLNHKHVTILNYYDSNSFELADFCDGHHLNLRGAKKLTEMIRKNINNEEIVCQKSAL